jgi:hypothetical protein
MNNSEFLSQAESLLIVDLILADEGQQSKALKERPIRGRLKTTNLKVI